MTRKLTEAEEELCRQAMLPVSTSAITGRRSFASSAALHESSHAVVALSLGLKFHTALLVPIVEDDTVLAGSVQGFEFSLDDPCPNNVHVLLAPLAASDMFPFSSLGCGKDHKDAIGIGRYAYKLSTEDEFIPWFTKMWERTQAITEPLLKDIALLAEQLDVRKLMSYEDVCEVLGRDSEG